MLLGLPSFEWRTPKTIISDSPRVCMADIVTGWEKIMALKDALLQWPVCGRHRQGRFRKALPSNEVWTFMWNLY